LYYYTTILQSRRAAGQSCKDPVILDFPFLSGSCWRGQIVYVYVRKGYSIDPLEGHSGRFAYTSEICTLSRSSPYFQAYLWALSNVCLGIYICGYTCFVLPYCLQLLGMGSYAKRRPLMSEKRQKNLSNAEIIAANV
jgi:hypothetical protein